LSGSVQGNGAGQYAAGDITTMTTAIAAATTVNTQPAATQTELNTAVTTLNTAVSRFQSSVVVVDRNALLAAIAAASSVLAGAVQGSGVGEYSFGDMAALTTEIAAATAVSTKPAATQTELDAGAMTLNTAVTMFQNSKIVDRSVLLTTITAANNVLTGAVQGSGPGEYAAVDITALTAAIAAATTVSTKLTVTQTELDAEVTKLNAAVTIFQSSVVVVDRSVLTAAITAANNVLTGAVQGSGPGEYAAADITALTTAIAAATTVSTKLAVTQTELDAEVTTLNAAVTIFQGSVVVVDRSVLTAAITAANNVLTGAVQGSGAGEYAAADITALTTAIAAATTASTKLAVTQTELDAEVTKLIAAVTIFQSSVVVVDRSVLTAAITAANNVLTGAVQGSGAGEYAAVDITALTTAIAAATTVSTKLTVTQTELDAEVTTLNVAVTTFQNSMVGAVLLFAEETLSGEHHILVLTFNHPLQAIANSSEFSLSNVTTTIVSAELDSQNSSKVRLLLSEALPASGEVTITASSSAVIFNDRTNTALSSMYVLLIGDIVQLREGLLSSHDSSNGKIQISNITQYMKDHFATMEKHGITEKTFVQFFLQQVDPYFLPASPSGG
jgi:cell division protein FtsB